MSNDDQQHWGCEFVDEIQTKSFNYHLPWYEDPDVLLLPIEIVQEIAERKRFVEIYRSDKVVVLQNSIYTQGLQEPGLIQISSSHAKLKEGNHRLIACTNLGHTHFPVYLKDDPVQSGISNFKLVSYLLRKESRL